MKSDGVCDCCVCLPLTELEAFPSTRLTRFLSLDRTRVAGQGAVLPKLFAMVFIRQHQRSGHAESDRSRLARQPTALNPRLDVERTQRIRDQEGLLNVRHQ